ncbi:MAG: S8 family serine peptidase [Candidatus Kapaibacterium sp.]
MLLLFASASAFPQSAKIVLKFKQNTPESVLSDFKNGNLRNSRNPLLKAIEKYNVITSNRLFDNYINNSKLINSDSFGLERIFLLEANTRKVSELISEISQNKYVEYIHELRAHKLESVTPNDTYFSNQYYLNMINVPPVWDSQQGGALVGIIDSGMDFLHPDLQQSYYINSGEYGSGKESNGIDDDIDGFIDNWRGWNFIGNNNNNDDDNIYSHGSCVAGVISAGFNNGIGISSVTAGSKSLILKCFNSQGIGYEDHIASAILYSVMQGVKVINMSFGDYIYSSLLKDVIKYAYSRNVVLVASAGNDNSFVLHYPSSFDEVISVAANDENYSKASFSAYGVTVDLYAPGVNILTTSRLGKGSQEFGNDYMYANGTSFSAPIVASIASMLIAKNPALSNEDLRGILVSSTKYFFFQSNWDDYYSSGILNALSSYQNYNNPTTSRIYSPSLNYSFTNDTVRIAVTAASAFFNSYSIKYGTGLKPESYIDLFSSSVQAIRDTVFSWNTSSISDTVYTLKLQLQSNNGRFIEHSTIINKSESSPLITNYTNGEIVYKEGFSEFITFNTNVPTEGLIYYKRKNVNEPYTAIYADEGNIGCITTAHFAQLEHFKLSSETDYEYYIEANSQNGKQTVLNDSSFQFRTKKQIDKYSYIKKVYNLPKSQVFDKVVDITNNGSKNIFINNLSTSLTAEIYEFSNNKFLLSTPALISNNIIRDIILRNNKWSLLTSQQRNGNIYQSPADFQVPSVKIWTNDNPTEFWSSKFADVDGDGIEEVLGFDVNGLMIMKYQGNVTYFAHLNFIPQLTSSYANSQNVIVHDFDNDGKKEIVFTNSFFDNEGAQRTSVNIYEYVSGDSFTLLFHEEYPLVIKGDNLSLGDFNGDGQKEIAVGFSTDLAIPVKLFSVLFIKSTGSNTFAEYSSIELFNSDLQAEISSKAGDTDNDSKDELIISEGNSLYIVKYNQSANKFEPVFFKEGINSYNSITYDFDNNGIKEVGVNSADSLIFLEKNIPFAGPSTPAGLKGYSLDSNSVSISFQNVPFAQYYKIYKGNSDSTGYSVYDSNTSLNYIDNSVSNKRDYYYKVSAVDTTLPIKESVLSNYVKVFVHNKSKLLSAVYDKGSVFIKFSGKIPLVIPNPELFVLNGNIYPNSVVIKSNYEYALSFKEKIGNGTNTIKTKNLFDFYSSPVDTNAVTFSVQNYDSSSFYISTLKLVNNNTLTVEFNSIVDTVSAYNLSNYSIEPFNLKVISVVRDNSNKKLLSLGVNSSGNIGASGKTYFIRLNNIYSETGAKIVEGSGSMFSLSFVKEDLSGIAVYPNPFSKSKATKQAVTFANLTKTAKIYVYSITGAMIVELTENDGNGGVEWDLRDSKGNEVPSGIYIYKVEGQNSQGVEVESKMSKFAVIK